MMFTNSYAACQVCAPTGADLMTRKYPGLIKQLYAKKNTWCTKKHAALPSVNTAYQKVTSE